MERLATFALLVALLTLTNAQSSKKFGAWSEHVSTRNYYPNDTLNLVTLGVINGKKYLFANEEASWFEASYFCNAHGMDLVSIETQHENDLIMEHIAKLGLTNAFVFWISGNNIGTSSWIWINGEFVIFSDWAIGQPDNSALDHCIFIYYGKWNDGYCEWRGETDQSGFICEERFEESDNEIESRSIYRMKTLMDYWTSAHQIGRSTWLWINGENMIYSDWASGQPSNPTSDHCMHIFNSSWFDNSCRWTKDSRTWAALICETRELLLGNGTEADTYYPADMMNMVTLGPGDGKKYLVINQPATWFESSYFCNAHGMDLVTIETKEENDALVDHLATIGFNTSWTYTSGHKMGRATYLWINGEYMLYSDWATGEPSRQSEESCLILWRNDWYDLDCNKTAINFICEERIVQADSNTFLKEFRLF